MKDATTKSILQMTLGALSFSVMAAFVKLSCLTLPSFEVVFFRSLLGTVAIAIVMARARAPWRGRNPLVNTLRGVAGFIALTFHFYCISTLDLGTAVMLNFTAPIFVVILAHVFLKEKTRWIVTALILLSFVGVYLLAAPKLEANMVPILLGLGSGIFAAIAFTLIRFSKTEESPYTIIFYFTAISTVASVPLLKFGFIWPSAFEWVGLIGVTTGAFFGQIFLTKSIQGAPVTIVLPFTYLTPVFAATFGLVFWNEVWTLQAVIGASIIIACGVTTYLLREKPAFIPLEE